MIEKPTEPQNSTELEQHYSRMTGSELRGVEQAQHHVLNGLLIILAALAAAMVILFY